MKLAALLCKLNSWACTDWRNRYTYLCVTKDPFRAERLSVHKIISSNKVRLVVDRKRLKIHYIIKETVDSFMESVSMFPADLSLIKFWWPHKQGAPSYKKKIWATNQMRQISHTYHGAKATRMRPYTARQRTAKDAQLYTAFSYKIRGKCGSGEMVRTSIAMRQSWKITVRKSRKCLKKSRKVVP